MKLASDKQTSQIAQFRPNFDRIDREDREAEAAERLSEQQEDEEFGRIAQKNPVYRDFSNLISTVGNSACCLNHTLNSYHYLNDRIAYYQNLLNNLNSSEKVSDSKQEEYQNKFSHPDGVESISDLQNPEYRDLPSNPDGAKKLSDLLREEYQNKLTDLESNRQFLMKNGYPKDEPPRPDAKQVAMTFLYLDEDCLSREPGMAGVASQIKSKIDELGNLNLSPSNFEQCIQSQADILDQIKSMVSSAWEKYHNVQGQEAAAPSKLWNYSSKPESYADFFRRMENPFKNDILFQKICRLRPEEFVKV